MNIATDGRRFVPAPPGFGFMVGSNSSSTFSSCITGVYLDINEEVEWFWYHRDNVSFVNGYTIKQKS